MLHRTLKLCVVLDSRYGGRRWPTLKLTQRCGTTLATVCNAVIAPDQSIKACRSARQAAVPSSTLSQTSMQTRCICGVKLEGRGDFRSRPLALHLLGFIHREHILTPLDSSTLRSTVIPAVRPLRGRFVICSRSSRSSEHRRNSFPQLNTPYFGLNAVSATFACSAFSMQTLARASFACLALSCVLLCTVRAADPVTLTVAAGACTGVPYNDIGQKFHYTTQVTITGNASCIR